MLSRSERMPSLIRQFSGASGVKAVTSMIRSITSGSGEGEFTVLASAAGLFKPAMPEGLALRLLMRAAYNQSQRLPKLASPLRIAATFPCLIKNAFFEEKRESSQTTNPFMPL